MGNPRKSNGNRRRKIKARLKAQQLPCALCGKPIDYSLTTYVDPTDGKRKPHPMSFTIDERVPVSRYAEGGYSSPEEAALDVANCQPAHWICNVRAGAKNKPADPKTKPLPLSGEW